MIKSSSVIKYLLVNIFLDVFMVSSHNHGGLISQFVNNEADITLKHCFSRQPT